MKIFTISYLLILLLSSDTHASNEFSRYVENSGASVESYLQEFAEYKTVLGKEYLDHKTQVLKEWGNAEISGPKVFVQYSKDFKTRSSVDFDGNTLSVSVRDSSQASAKHISNQLKEVLGVTVSKAADSNKLLKGLNANRVKSDKPLLGSTFSSDEIKKMISNARMSFNNDDKGSYTKVTIALPNTATIDRARAILPHVKKYAKEFKVDPSLIYAVIHTESSFNPLAQSHIPAFGLMQIVPQSAGRDVHKLLSGRDSEPSKSLLLRPDSNIRYGTAYLHLLDKKYLSSIKDPVSRRYCVIAAYNTGAGNVAKAFTGNTSIKSAAKRINSMTSDQVYRHLLRNLAYKEARDYLNKVNSRIKTYS